MQLLAPLSSTYCKKCHRPLPAEDAYCRSCGTKAPKRRLTELQKFLVFFAIFVAVMILGAASFIWSQVAADARARTARAEAAAQTRADSARAVAIALKPEDHPLTERIWADSLLHHSDVPPPSPELRASVVRDILSRGDSMSRAAQASNSEALATAANSALRPLSWGSLPERDSVRRERIWARTNRVTEAAAARRAIAARRAYADRMETVFLDQGLDVRVSTRGSEHTTLRMEYVLFGRVWAHKLSQTSMLTDAQVLGFRRVVMTDGYDDTWTWDLTK